MNYHKAAKALLKDTSGQRLGQIVYLYFVKKIPQHRIARRLGVHRSTVGRRLTKALGLVKQSLAL